MGRKIDIRQGQFWLSLLLFLLIGLPLGYSLISLLFSGHLLQDISSLRLDFWRLVIKSMVMATIIGIGAVAMGVVLAFWLYKTRMPYRHLLKLILIIPLFVSPYILAVAWRDVLFWRTHFSSGMMQMLGNIWVQIIIYTPLAMLITGSSLMQIEANIEESGLMLMPKRKVLQKIILPLIKPALLTAFVLIFIFSISDFTIPAFFGVKVFSTEIFTQFSAFYNHSLALLQSLVLVAICLGLLWTERRQLTGASFLSVGGKGMRHKLYKAPSKTAWGIVIFWLSVSVLLPLVVLSAQTFAHGTLVFFKAFELLFLSFSASVVLAITVAFGTVVIGLIGVYFYRNESPFIQITHTFALLGFAIPAGILGISFIGFYNRPTLNFIYGSYWVLGLAYVAKFSYIAIKMIENGRKKVPVSLDEAAQIAGIGKVKRFLRIWIPLLSPSIFAAFTIVFIISISELGMAIMLYPPGTQLVSIKLFTLMANAPQALTAAMSLVVFLMMLMLMGLLYFVFRKLNRRQSL